MRLNLAIVLILLNNLGFGTPPKSRLSFLTSSGHTVSVNNGAVFYDNRKIKNIEDGAIIYDSKSNRIIEDHGSVFLFIALDGRPNLDRLQVFKISSAKAILVADAMLSAIKDYDNDGYLEFGGRDLTEMYPNRDSMYYIPSVWYEIRMGKIYHDVGLTKHNDILVNGTYIPPAKQLDNGGYCCVVIPKPGKIYSEPDKLNSDLIKKSFMGSDTITVSATKYVLVDKDDITNVVHGNDGSWLFYSNNRTYTPETAAKKVKLGSIIKIDRTVLLLNWMPKGYYATRTSKKTSWVWDKLKPKN
jgi:hypothetical protein